MPRLAPSAARSLVALAFVAALGLAACSSSKASSEGSTSSAAPTTSTGTTTTSSTSTTTTTAATTTSEVATTTSAAPATTAAGATTSAGGGPVTTGANPLNAALLTPADLPGSWTSSPGTPSDPNQPLPCGTPNPNKVVPPSAQALVQLNSSDGNFRIDQHVMQYDGEPRAVAAYPIGQAGFSCGSGTGKDASGSTYTFNLTEQELPDGLGSEAFAYQGTVTQGSTTANIIFVVIRNGEVITTMQFQANPNASAPDALPIIQTAAERLANVA